MKRLKGTIEGEYGSRGLMKEVNGFSVPKRSGCTETYTPSVMESPRHTSDVNYV